MAVTRREAGAASPVDYETLAELRYQIRLFMRRREEAARAAGIEPQQYLLLLQLKGLEDRGPTTVGALAERLQIRHHSAVELVDRLVERDMVARRRDSIDRREVSVPLRPAGEAVLRKLALYSMEELRTEGPELEQRRQPGRVVDGPPAARHLPDDHRAEGRPLRLRQVRHPAERYEDARRQRGVAEEQQHDAGAHRGPLRRARHQRVQPGARRAPGQGDDELSRQPGCGAEPREHHLLR